MRVFPRNFEFLARSPSVSIKSTETRKKCSLFPLLYSLLKTKKVRAFTCITFIQIFFQTYFNTCPFREKVQQKHLSLEYELVLYIFLYESMYFVFLTFEIPVKSTQLAWKCLVFPKSKETRLFRAFD